MPHEFTAASFIKRRKSRQITPQGKDVLKLIIYCYKKIHENECFEMTRTGSPTKLENVLKYNLVDYLTKNKKQFPLTKRLLFVAEAADFDNQNHREAFIDIAVYNAFNSFKVSPGIYTEEDYYFAFECKRLENNSKNDDYIKKGIRKYVGNKYARAMPFAGMIGFVEKGNIFRIKDDINRRLIELNQRGEIKTPRLLEFEEIEKDFRFTFLSSHCREASSHIDLYHLFLDYKEILS